LLYAPHHAPPQAFVPRIHNRDVPVASRPVAWREQRASLIKHAVALDRIQPRIDNKWGQTWNGVQEQKRASYPHVRSNLKRAQLQDERFQAIELENYLLLGKLSKILERSHNPTHKTREWGGGVRLTGNQVPVIDHCVPQNTTEFGAAVEPTSLNIGFRQRQQDEIAAQNRKLVKRLQMSRPTYETNRFLSDWHDRERWLLNQRVANRPLVVQEGVVRPQRPASATAAVGRRRPDSASTTGSIAVPPRRPDRPRTAAPKGPSKPAAPIEQSVVTVLELLSSQMQEAGSLAQVRQKRDSLMDGVYRRPAEVEVEQIDGAVAGAPVEVVRPLTASGEVVLVLVHGGMFMAGSGRAMRHLAAQLASVLGVAVATPSLRLAPEHPHPAALDDLCAAYDYIAKYGIDGHPPERIGLFAESSGGALAITMLLRRKAAHESLPAAVAMASPWLDLTCSGGSFIVNEEYDLVLQKERMVGIVAAYLGPDGSAEDAEISPLLAPPEVYAGLPPMLLHVGESEVLLDDARQFAESARLHGSEVLLKEWGGVVHAWHTFFPLMPKAAAALAEVADFLRPLLLPGSDELDAALLEPASDAGAAPSLPP